MTFSFFDINSGTECVNTWPAPLSYNDHILSVTSGYYFPTTSEASVTLASINWTDI